MEDHFTIHASEYTYCHFYDEAAHACTPGNDAIFDIRMSASTFYVTTGTHGVHVFGGMVALAYMVLKAFRGGYTPENAVSIEYFGCIGTLWTWFGYWSSPHSICIKEVSLWVNME